MPDAILALNAGSSSVKFGLYESRAGALSLAARGKAEELGAAPRFIARDAGGQILEDRRWDAGRPAYEQVLGALLDWVEGHLGADRLAAVGHRIVHGGQRFERPVRLDDDVLAALDALTKLAPLHQPHSLAPARAIAALRPGLPQIACFDTAFHHGMAPVATRFALPRGFEEQGVRRYGFHGLSYEFIARRLCELAPDLARGRVIVAHLGNGASLCAMHDGRSVDTTMGFTALDGLVMGTRCGTLDPGVVLYLLQQHRMTPDEVENLLYCRSGLLGVSGLSSDMRSLLASDEARAREAVELFAFRIARETAALAASLQGLDGIVFTAGIGEHAPEIRTMACARLRWLGIALDETANRRGGPRISAAGSAIEVWVIPTDEEAMIARHTAELLACDQP